MSGDFCKHYDQVVTEFFQTVIALLKRALELDKVCGGNFGFIFAEEAFAPDVDETFPLHKRASLTIASIGHSASDKNGVP